MDRPSPCSDPQQLTREPPSGNWLRVAQSCLNPPHGNAAYPSTGRRGWPAAGTPRRGASSGLREVPPWGVPCILPTAVSMSTQKVPIAISSNTSWEPILEELLTNFLLLSRHLAKLDTNAAGADEYLAYAMRCSMSCPPRNGELPTPSPYSKVFCREALAALCIHHRTSLRRNRNHRAILPSYLLPNRG